MRPSDAPAPIVAATTTSKLPVKEVWLASAIPPGPRTNKAIATPKLAPLLTPKTNGSAQGLRNTVCIIRPAAANDAPANVAVAVRGNRNSKTIAECSVPASSDPIKLFITSNSGMLTDPKHIPAMNATAPKTIRKKNEKTILLLSIFLPHVTYR